MAALPYGRPWGRRLLGAVLVLSVSAALLGCSHKDDAPTAPGYYSGPMTKATKMDPKAPKGGE